MLQRQGGKTLLTTGLSWLGMKFRTRTTGVFSSLNTLIQRQYALASLPKTFPPRLPNPHLPIPPSPHAASRLPLLLVLTLCVLLSSCSWINPGPAKTVVEQAIAQKLMATQTLLRTQLPGESEATNPFAIGRVTVTSTRQISLDNQAAVEVEGTYTLKGGNLSRAQRQQVSPFNLYLQQGEDKEQWWLLEPKATGGYSRRQVNS